MSHYELLYYESEGFEVIDQQEYSRTHMWVPMKSLINASLEITDKMLNGVRAETYAVIVRWSTGVGALTIEHGFATDSATNFYQHLKEHIR